FIKWGHNRDKEKLPQLNLAMLFGQKSALPVYYHRVPGNISDVSTLRNLRIPTQSATGIRSIPPPPGEGINDAG
ncbi:MAG: hypothetical protein KKC25_08560, partial [Proteobacteria bacterium]|nr:hypothetical protein [Pseudomonadota bacterium]